MFTPGQRNALHARHGHPAQPDQGRPPFRPHHRNPAHGLIMRGQITLGSVFPILIAGTQHTARGGTPTAALAQPPRRRHVTPDGAPLVSARPDGQTWDRRTARDMPGATVRRLRRVSFRRRPPRAARHPAGGAAVTADAAHAAQCGKPISPQTPEARSARRHRRPGQPADTGGPAGLAGLGCRVAAIECREAAWPNQRRRA
jgi:hypothetical protein